MLKSFIFKFLHYYFILNEAVIYLVKNTFLKSCNAQLECFRSFLTVFSGKCLFLKLINDDIQSLVGGFNCNITSTSWYTQLLHRTPCK